MNLQINDNKGLSTCYKMTDLGNGAIGHTPLHLALRSGSVAGRPKYLFLRDVTLSCQIP